MADFVAVLRKTLDGLNDPNAETRERVYERARATVLARLEAIQPPPPQAVADRQIRALEDAISTVEQGYAPPPAKPLDPLDELEDVFASLNGLKDQATIPMRPVATPPAKPVVAPAPVAPKPAVPAPIVAKPAIPASAPAPRTSAYEPRKPLATPTPVAPAPRPMPAATPPAIPNHQPARDIDPDFDEPVRLEPQAPRPSGRVQPAQMDDDEQDFEDTRLAGSPREGRRGFGGLIAAVLVLAALAGAGYGVWINKDEFARMVGINQPDDPATTAETPATPQDPADVAAAQPPAAEAPAETPAPAPETAAPATPETPPKLTQRLNEDGSEIDAGPAAGGASVGEGTSVAAATQPSQPPAAQTPPLANPAQPPATVPDPAVPAPGDPTQPPAAATPPAATPPAAAQPATPPVVAVGQKAIFYEERTSAAAGSAEEGSTVWSVVQESPGGDRPPEAAIRAVATIPGRNVELRMTIRRNADPTLPASHIIEMIFLTPDNSSEGSVDNILRMAMKGAEQEAGNPVIGLPAKIGDGFFLIALNDNKAEIDANMNLLQRQNWIDIAVVYKSGRRALITMEKGIPGEKVFNDVLKGWGVATSG